MIFKDHPAVSHITHHITSTSEDEFEQFGKVSIGGRRVKKLRLETKWERWTNSAIPKKDNNVKNPIRWWWDRRFEYPILYQIAMDIFSIPAMSSECERVFSQLRRLITFERTRLGCKRTVRLVIGDAAESGRLRGHNWTAYRRNAKPFDLGHIDRAIAAIFMPKCVGVARFEAVDSYITLPR
jgi:hypothetical protein